MGLDGLAQSAFEQRSSSESTSTGSDAGVGIDVEGQDGKEESGMVKSNGGIPAGPACITELSSARSDRLSREARPRCRAMSIVSSTATMAKSNTSACESERTLVNMVGEDKAMLPSWV